MLWHKSSNQSLLPVQPPQCCQDDPLKRQIWLCSFPTTQRNRNKQTKEENLQRPQNYHHAPLPAYLDFNMSSQPHVSPPHPVTPHLTVPSTCTNATIPLGLFSQFLHSGSLHYSHIPQPLRCLAYPSGPEQMSALLEAFCNLSRKN